MNREKNERENVDIPMAEEARDKSRRKRARRDSAHGGTYARRGVRASVRVFCAVALVLVIGAAVWILRRPAGPAVSAELDIVASPSGVNLPFRDGFLSVTATGYTYYNGEGISEGFRAAALPNPAALCTEKRFFIYSRGGTAILCADAAREIYSAAAPGSILSAAVNERNQLAVVSDSEYHKGEITLYAQDGGVLFSYKAAEVYPYLCALSPDGGFLAAAVLTCDGDGDPATAVYAFSLSEGSITGSAVFSGETICSIICGEEQNITVITEKGMHLVDANGTVLADFLPENAEVTRFAVHGENAFLFCERKAPGKRYELISLRRDCTECGRRESDTDCVALSAGENCVALCTGSRLVVMRDDLTELAVREAETACRDATFGTDGRLCVICAEKVVFYVIE